MTLLLGADFGALFETYEHTAFRLEVRDSYLGVGYEQEPFRKWQVGEPDDMAWRRDWLDGVRRRAAEGRSMSRVRVVSMPPTDYVRFSYRNCADNIEAGEDIRYLDRADALDLPAYDYWLFDSLHLYTMHFDDENAFHGAELVTDPAIVAQHLQWRDEAWRRSAAYRDFAIS